MNGRRMGSGRARRPDGGVQAAFARSGVSCLVARGDRQLSRRPHGRCPLAAQITLASANVQTLLPHQGDRSYAKNTVNPLLSKVEALETQFVSQCFNVVGVQEGRARSSGERVGTK